MATGMVRLPLLALWGVSASGTWAIFEVGPGYTVQVSPDLTTWQDGSSFLDGGFVLTTALTSTASNPTDRETIVRLNQVLGAAGKTFLRVRVRG